MKLNTFPIEITFNIEFTSTYVLTNITKTNANFHSFVIPKLLIVHIEILVKLGLKWHRINL